jgi:tetratricopeptide (TPR) repeat protein
MAGFWLNAPLLSRKPMARSLRRWLLSVVFMSAFMTWLMLGTTPAMASPLLPEDLSKAAFNAGVRAYQSGQLAEAVQSFTEAIEADPELASAYSNRCLAELQQALEGQAIADCTRSLTLNPANPNDYLNRGLAHYRLMQSQAALADFNQVLELTPDDYRAYYNLGLTRFDLADYEGAISDYDQSLTHSLDLPHARRADIYNDRAIAYLALNRPQQALADLNQALELNQADTRAYFNRACCHHQMGDWVASLGDYDRVLATNPDYPQAYFNRAILHQQMGHTQAAIADLSQAAHQFRDLGLGTRYQQALNLLRHLQEPPSAWG